MKMGIQPLAPATNNINQVPKNIIKDTLPGKKGAAPVSEEEDPDEHYEGEEYEDDDFDEDEENFKVRKRNGSYSRLGLISLSYHLMLTNLQFRKLQLILQNSLIN